MLDPAVLKELRAFRTRVYGCFGPRRDALFELLDAAITSGLVPALVHLSLDGLYRRRWGSLYAALAEGEVEAEGVRSLVAQHPLAGGEPIYAVDTSAWPRNDAETSPERGYYHHPSRHSAGKPIVAGWCSSCWHRWGYSGRAGRLRWTCVGSTLRWQRLALPRHRQLFQVLAGVPTQSLSAAAARPGLSSARSRGCPGGHRSHARWPTGPWSGDRPRHCQSPRPT